jgi:hypothetical protein
MSALGHKRTLVLCGGTVTVRANRALPTSQRSNSATKRAFKNACLQATISYGADRLALDEAPGGSGCPI